MNRLVHLRYAWANPAAQQWAGWALRRPSASILATVTHDEAVAEAERLRREHPQRRQLVFAPRERADGGWEVVTARLDGIELPADERQAETRAGPQVTPDPTESQTPPVHGQRGF
jgi:hypothetical protein